MELNGDHYGIFAFTRNRGEKRFNQNEWHKVFSRAMEVTREEAGVMNLNDFYNDWCERPYAPKQEGSAGE